MGGGRVSVGGGSVGGVGVSLLLMASCHLAATLTALPGSLASRAAAAANPSLSPGRNGLFDPRRSLTRGRFGAAGVLVLMVGGGVDICEGGEGTHVMERASLPALLAWKARLAWAWRRSTSCGDGGGRGASGSGAVSLLPFALFPLFFFFFGGRRSMVVDDGVGMAACEAGTYSSSSSSDISIHIGVLVPTPQSLITAS